MSKPILMVLGAIIVFALLFWLFAGAIAEGVAYLWALDDTTRKKLNDWISIASGLAGIIGGIWIGITWLKRRNKAGENTEVEPVNPSPPTQTTQALTESYYTNLSKQCQRYDLGSFRVSKSIADETAVQVELADVYVDLMAQEDKPEKTEAGDGNDKASTQISSSKLILDFLKDPTLNRLVIRGDVGSGKSSIINYLSYGIIESLQGRRSQPDIPEPWLRRPVVRLLLREIGAQICQATDLEKQLFKFMHKRTRDHILNSCDIQEDVFKQMWKEFRTEFEKTGVLILDGLDEVSGSHENPEELTRRQILLQTILRLSQNKKYKGMSIIITSRNNAYGGDDALKGFRLLQLDPLNSSDRYEVFIKHWYQKIAQTQEEQENNKQDALKLLNNIAKRGSLNTFTGTPLLITLMLVLDKARIGLPESRAELYKSAIDLLLDGWPKQLLSYSESVSRKEQQALEVLDKDASILLEAMKLLAYETYQDAEGQGRDRDANIVFSVAMVEKALKEQLHVAGLGFDHQDSCRFFLGQRSQILVAGGDGLSFVHKSFHEYLAAAFIMDRHMSCDGELWEMVASADKRDGWREVFLFALNIGKAEYVMKIMKDNVLSHQVATLKQRELDNHLSAMSLFSIAVLENKLEKVVSRRGAHNAYLKEAYNNLQAHIKLLWEDRRLSIPQRAQLGRISGRCGDRRPGMTFQRDGDEIRYQSTATRSFPVPDIKWQRIKQGAFMMGTVGEKGYKNEKPVHNVPFAQPFHISKTAITNGQYRAFIDAGGYDDESIWNKLPKAARDWRQGEFPGMALLDSFPEKDREEYRQFLLNDRIRHQPRLWQDNRWNIANHPVVGVSWYEALAYCEWLNQQQTEVLPSELAEQGLTLRLPTEDEWEYAARGTESLEYACGKSLSSERANYDETELGRTTAAGVFPESIAFSLHDMTGNVWEWTASSWGEDAMHCAFGYENYLDKKAEQNDSNELDYRIVRGGSWGNSSVDARCAIRYRLHPNIRDYDLGFRVVCSR